MVDSISVAAFMRANDLRPDAGLRGPMASSNSSSIHDFISKHTPRWGVIRGSFRDDDVQHMLYGSPEGEVLNPINLADYRDVRAHANEILIVVSSSDDTVRMPPPPSDPWGPTLISLFRRWVAGGTPN